MQRKEKGMALTPSAFRGGGVKRQQDTLPQVRASGSPDSRADGWQEGQLCRRGTGPRHALVTPTRP